MRKKKIHYKGKTSDVTACGIYLGPRQLSYTEVWTLLNKEDGCKNCLKHKPKPEMFNKKVDTPKFKPDDFRILKTAAEADRNQIATLNLEVENYEKALKHHELSLMVESNGRCTLHDVSVLYETLQKDIARSISDSIDKDNQIATLTKERDTFKTSVERVGKQRDRIKRSWDAWCVSVCESLGIGEDDYPGTVKAAGLIAEGRAAIAKERDDLKAKVEQLEALLPELDFGAYDYVAGASIGWIAYNRGVSAYNTSFTRTPKAKPEPTDEWIYRPTDEMAKLRPEAQFIDEYRGRCDWKDALDSTLVYVDAIRCLSEDGDPWSDCRIRRSELVRLGWTGEV